MSTAILALLALTPAAAPAVPPPPSAMESARQVAWRSGRLPDALAEARERGTKVFAYFWSASSQQCANTWNDSLQSQPAQDELATFVCFSVDVARPESGTLLAKYNVTTLPTMLVLLPDGQADDALIGYHSPSLLVGDLQRIQQGVDTVTARRQAAEAAPDDLVLRFNLAAKLEHVGEKVESRALFDSIIEDDPKGDSEVSARLQLWDVQNEIAADSSDPTDRATFDLKPLYRHVKRIRPEQVAFEAWTWAIEIERDRGDRKKTLRAMREAWDVAPDPARLRWGVETVLYHWEARDQVSNEAKRFALEVAETCVELQDEQTEKAEAAGDERERYDVEPLDALAVCYHLNGRTADALATLERSVERNGASAEREQWRTLIESGKP